MSEILGMALRNQLLGKGSMRSIFQDCIMRIYSGSAPATADEAKTGVLLLEISNAGGAVAVDAFAIPSRWLVTIPGTHATGTYAVTITVEAVPYTCLFDATAAADHASNDVIANGLARAINKTCPSVFAIGAGDETTPVSSAIYVQAKIPGIHVGIVDGGGTITPLTPITELLPLHADAANTIRFGLPSAGAMAKNASVWSDTVLVSGVAGYFRIVTTHDDGTDDTTSLDQPRAQGTISTSGAELNMANTSLVAGEVHTVDSYSISLPAE